MTITPDELDFGPSVKLPCAVTEGDFVELRIVTLRATGESILVLGTVTEGKHSEILVQPEALREFAVAAVQFADFVDPEAPDGSDFLFNRLLERLDIGNG